MKGRIEPLLAQPVMARPKRILRHHIVRKRRERRIQVHHVRLRDPADGGGDRGIISLRGQEEEAGGELLDLGVDAARLQGADALPAEEGREDGPPLPVEVVRSRREDAGRGAELPREPGRAVALAGARGVDLVCEGGIGDVQLEGVDADYWG